MDIYIYFVSFIFAVNSFKYYLRVLKNNVAVIVKILTLSLARACSIAYAVVILLGKNKNPYFSFKNF